MFYLGENWSSLVSDVVSVGPDLSEKDTKTICFRLWNDQVRSGCIRSSCRSRDQDLVQQLGAFSQNFTVLEAFLGQFFGILC